MESRTTTGATLRGSRAAAYLYADRAPLALPMVEWLSWTADRPQPGGRVPRHHPLATVFADGDTPDAAERLARERLGLLEEMIYERANTEEVRK